MKFLFASFAASFVSGHAVMTNPLPRIGLRDASAIRKTPSPPSLQDLNGCLTSKAGPISATFQAGSKQEIDWKILIKHTSAPGVRIAIQYNPSDNFQELLAGQDIETGKATITLPAGKTSENAVLQWVWDSSSDNAFYLSCADIKVVDAGNKPSNVTSTTVDGKSVRSCAKAKDKTIVCCDGVGNTCAKGALKGLLPLSSKTNVPQPVKCKAVQGAKNVCCTNGTTCESILGIKINAGNSSVSSITNPVNLQNLKTQLVNIGESLVKIGQGLAKSK